tara:strand:- start:130 stop:531 length:402 start_codon:yes stop_codon:yes gene_type:complete
MPSNPVIALKKYRKKKMNGVNLELEVAEKYLDEMLEADRTGDYQGFIKRFDNNEMEEFNEEDFQEDVELMLEDLGSYKSRTLLGHLNGFIDPKYPKNSRFVWRAIYEKNEALIVVGIHQIEGVWYVNESNVSK